MTKIPLHTLFNISPGNSLDLNVLEETNIVDEESVNYVSRTRENNGISAIVRLMPTIDPFPPGRISVAGSGNSVLESFIQPAPFYTGYHVFVLEPIKQMTDLEKLFYCFCIRQNQYKYNYGRQANRTLKDILVPSVKDIPKEFLNAKVTKLNPNAVSNDEMKLNVTKWKTFKYGGANGVFDIKNGYYNKKPDHTEKGKIPFIGASEFNNGVTGYFSVFDIENTNKSEGSVEHDLEQKIFTGNCITVNNNGTSIGNAFYQEKDFTCSHDVNVLYLKDREFNKYIAMFICTLIQLRKI